LGQNAAGNADIAMAKKEDPKIAEYYQPYGLGE
jgi:hypothetical protein